MKRTMRERSNAVFGALLLEPKSLSPALFTLGAEHQLYANLYRAVVASQSSECAGSPSKDRNKYPSSCRCRFSESVVQVLFQVYSKRQAPSGVGCTQIEMQVTTVTYE